MSRALVIGVGNPDRGDDGVGPAVARRLPELEDVRVELSAGGATELLELLSVAPLVVVVDAMRSGAAPGTIRRVEAVATARASRGSTHGLGVVEAIELCRCLGRRPPWLVLLGVEGADFTPGAGLSPAVAAAVPAAVQRVLGWLARAGCAGPRRPREAIAGPRRPKRSGPR